MTDLLCLCWKFSFLYILGLFFYLFFLINGSITVIINTASVHIDLVVVINRQQTCIIYMLVVECNVNWLRLKESLKREWSCFIYQLMCIYLMTFILKEKLLFKNSNSSHLWFNKNILAAVDINYSWIVINIFLCMLKTYTHMWLM